MNCVKQDCTDDDGDDELTLLGLVRNSLLNRSLWVGPGLDKMVHLLCLLLNRHLPLRIECRNMLLNGTSTKVSLRDLNSEFIN
jgi:hypothetical protein